MTHLGEATGADTADGLVGDRPVHGRCQEVPGGLRLPGLW